MSLFHALSFKNLSVVLYARHTSVANEEKEALRLCWRDAVDGQELLCIWAKMSVGHTKVVLWCGLFLCCERKSSS